MLVRRTLLVALGLVALTFAAGAALAQCPAWLVAVAQVLFGSAGLFAAGVGLFGSREQVDAMVREVRRELWPFP